MQQTLWAWWVGTAFLVGTLIPHTVPTRAWGSTQQEEMRKTTDFRCVEDDSGAVGQERYQFAQTHMGVSIQMTLYASDADFANKAAAAAFARIAAIDGMMSDYRSDSELVQLCRDSGPGQPVRVSPELLKVLECSLQLSERTNGAFDVTVGPVVRLWRRARRRKQFPDAQRLVEARALSGYRLIRLNHCSSTVELLKSGMRLDLGGIAKGFAADEALAVLRQHAVFSALIDAGGDIVVSDPPPGRDAWRIEIAQPPFLRSMQSHDQTNDPPLSQRPILLLRNAAVATSGDTYQYVRIKGKRYSHIVDPRTGIALTRPGSATVIAPTGQLADGLASAVCVLGPERGVSLIEQTEETAVYIAFLDDDSDPQVVRSRHLNALFAPQTDH